MLAIPMPYEYNFVKDAKIIQYFRNQRKYYTIDILCSQVEAEVET